MKKIIVIDFDGVIHSYVSGWKGETVIPDPPVVGALDALKTYSEIFRVAILSSRSTPEGIEAMKAWFEKHGFDHKILEFPIKKPPAFLTIDDRAVTFTGTFPDISMIENFKTWQHKD